MATIDLRPWQAEALNKSIEWLVQDRADRHFLINAAPGAGKTICASVIAQRLIELGEISRVIVIAPRAEVVRQWGEEYKFVTGRPMIKITGGDEEPVGYGTDLCATWSAVQGALDGFHEVCRSSETLVICDEHHHAAVEAAWGDGANGAFELAKFVLILTGTPIRSDGKETVWFAYDSDGRIDHPERGTYTLTYGKAVDLNYCRPITFHRHEGKFRVTLPDGDGIAVSGTEETEFGEKFQRIKGLQQALDYYKLACTPKYLGDGVTPDIKSYQATMLTWAINKLDDLRATVPNAGGLIIAPNIPVAEYMAKLLEKLDGEKPTIVHSQIANADGRIAAFKNTNKRWIVSVAMISEGVDIKRLRLLVYLPNAQTELAFRQAMGRVVRSLGLDDYSRAYVVMPTHRIFEEYARRVELEMSPRKRADDDRPKTKICPACGASNELSAKFCEHCDEEFPPPRPNLYPCPKCDGLNPTGAKECQHCGESFRHDFELSLEDALRMGAIVRGMDLEEEEVQAGERNSDAIIRELVATGDPAIIKVVQQIPLEALDRVRRILNQDDKK